MKRIILAGSLILALALAGCSVQAADAPAASAGPAVTQAPVEQPEERGATGGMEIVEITEKMFIAQCNDVYLNPDDYQGKLIRLEGMYNRYDDVAGGNIYHYVMRNGPGCCGYDGSAGFEFLYDGEIPTPDDWIEVIGTVEKMKENESEYIVLRAIKVTVLTERGAEFVNN